MGPHQHAPPSLLYHDNIIDNGFVPYFFPSEMSVDHLVKANLPAALWFDEGPHHHYQEEYDTKRFGLNLASIPDVPFTTESGSDHPAQSLPPLIFDFSSLSLNTDIGQGDSSRFSCAPITPEGSRSAAPVQGTLSGQGIPSLVVGPDKFDPMDSGITSPLIMSNNNQILDVGENDMDSRVVEEPMGRDMSLDDMFSRFIDLDGAVA